MGGTSKYESDDIYLMEYTFKGMVMNGSIFSWWGLYDYVLVSKDEGIYKKIMEKNSPNDNQGASDVQMYILEHV